MKHILSTLFLFVLAISAHAQYCTTDLYTAGCSDSDYIYSVVTTGGSTNINSVTPGCDTSLGGYTYYSTQTHTGLSGSYVAFTLTNNDDYAEGYAIFVDWNEDADFDDAGELVFTRELVESEVYTDSFYIPSTVTAGTKRLRVRCVFGPPASVLPCSLEEFGEVEDYNLAVVASPPCSGTPTAGTITASSSLTCPSQPVTLVASGFSTGVSGLLFQWEQRSAGTGAFAAVTGATANTLTVSPGGPEEYRLSVSCGSSIAYSDTVLLDILPGSACYCSPDNGSPAASLFPLNTTTYVSIPSTTLAAATTVEGPDGYLLQTVPPASNTATLAVGTTYTLVIGTDGSASSLGTVFSGAWIDYDTSGTFEPSEYIELTANSTNDSASGTFTVPASALLTTTRLRVISGLFAPVTDAAACDDVAVGEWEDYFVTIAPECSAPAPVNVTTAPGTAALSWATIPTATAYEYAATVSAAPPASGTSTTATTATLTGLPSAAAYYAHVRTICGGAASSWTTKPFTTGSVGIEDVARAGFSVSATPNPVKDILRVKVMGARKDASVRLLDAAGRTVRDIKLTNGAADLSTIGLPSGLYLLRYTDDGHTEVIRIQKL